MDSPKVKQELPIPKEKIMVSSKNLNQLFNLHNKVSDFVGGKLKYYYKNWEKHTSDKYIINIIRYGLKLDFAASSPESQFISHPVSKKESETLQNEILKLLKKGVITKTTKTADDFVSGLFTRDKKDGTKIMILNLKTFNTPVPIWATSKISKVFFR